MPKIRRDERSEEGTGVNRFNRLMPPPAYIPTVLGLPIDARHLFAHQKEQGLPLLERARIAIRQISALGFLWELSPEPNTQGFQLFLIGEPDWSRALAVHPRDHAGVLCVLEDDGQNLNVRRLYRATHAWWIDEIVSQGRRSVCALLGRSLHRNARLRPAAN